MKMTKLSEKYRVIANLYAYLEARPSNCGCANCHCEVIDNSDGLEIRESLYQEMIASPGARQLLDAVAAHGIEIYRYDESGYLDGEFFELPELA
jgi:hypothetical protein